MIFPNFCSCQFLIVFVDKSWRNNPNVWMAGRSFLVDVWGKKPRANVYSLKLNQNNYFLLNILIKRCEDFVLCRFTQAFVCLKRERREGIICCPIWRAHTHTTQFVMMPTKTISSEKSVSFSPF